MSNGFIDFGLRTELMNAVLEAGFSEPTPIQIAVIPELLSGKDIIGQAQTGTGKTAAFALPMLHNLNPETRAIQCLIVTPTRELAKQVAESVHFLGKDLKVRVLTVYGGTPYGSQINRLKRGVEVVVGTPGRLLDLIKKGYLDLGHVTCIILDEADEMLSMGFIEDIETILSETPDNRQTSLFSATLPGRVRKLAEKYMHDPVEVIIQSKQLSVDAIDQRYYHLKEKHKLSALTSLMETEEMYRTLIFSRTRVGSADLANALTQRGFPSEVLNGDISQEARERVLARFRKGQVSILVATDVAARGLDIDDISHVINYDLPNDSEIYVHRIGRTGRAGKSGIAYSLVTPTEIRRLRRIERFSRHKITQVQVPTREDVLNARDKKILDTLLIWLKRDRYAREKAMVESLIEDGHDPVIIAAAALKIARADERKRPIESINPIELKEAPRKSRHAKPIRKRKRYKQDTPDNISHEEGFTRLRLSLGKHHGIRPNDIVGQIAAHADIPGHTIGRIHILSKYSLVDIPKEAVDKVISFNNQYSFRKHKFKIMYAAED